MRIKEGRVIERSQGNGEVGRPVVPVSLRQINRHIAMDDETYRVAHVLRGKESLSAYIRRLIWEDYRRT